MTDGRLQGSQPTVTDGAEDSLHTEKAVLYLVFEEGAVGEGLFRCRWEAKALGRQVFSFSTARVYIVLGIAPMWRQPRSSLWGIRQFAVDGATVRAHAPGW